MTAVLPAAGLTAVYRPAEPVDVRATLSSLRRGGGDPTHRLDGAGALWRTACTPGGAATLRLLPVPAAAEVRAAAWGPGAGWLLDRLPQLLGARDDSRGFEPRHPLLRESHRRHGGLRVPCTGLVLEALVPAVLEQKVTGREARESWRQLLCRFGERAPGPAPAGMRVMPPAAAWARLPSWEWHLAGVDSKRAAAIRAAATVAARLEECAQMAPAAAAARLRAVPGIGPWTAAEVAQRALGDADAVSVGDFHLPALVGWALVGRPLDDDGMLEVLAPYRPHRYRAVRLLELSGARTPRFGPRYSPRDMRRL